MKYIGVDFHKQYFVSTVMDDKGEILRKDRVATDRNSIRSYFKRLKSKGALSVVTEACYGWSYFYDEIEDIVDEVKLAHPLKTRAIAEARIKTDSIDSQVLAHLLRADLVACAYIPDSDTRDKKNLLRYRSSLVRTRTAIKNRVLAVLSRNHIDNREFEGMSDKFGKSGMQYMRSIELKGNDTKILNHHLDLIEQINEKINQAHRDIRTVFRQDHICRLLESIPGIGYILSVIIRYEIDNIDRFINAKKLSSYSGLIPSTYSSGGRTFQGKITKQGNRWLRWALVEAAQSAVKYDPWLKSYYARISGKRGKNRAKVAVARKLAEIIFRVWKEGTPYYKKPVAVAL